MQSIGKLLTAQKDIQRGTYWHRCADESIFARASDKNRRNWHPDVTLHELAHTDTGVWHAPSIAGGDDGSQWPKRGTKRLPSPRCTRRSREASSAALAKAFLTF
jgi:hypothetical protein